MINTVFTCSSGVLIRYASSMPQYRFRFQKNRKSFSLCLPLTFDAEDPRNFFYFLEQLFYFLILWSFRWKQIKIKPCLN